MPIKNPQDRYENALETKRLPNGKLVYRSARPKRANLNPLSDVTIKASDVRRMDRLAKNAYGNTMDWWKIAAANRRVDGSLYFRPGSDIIIPSDM